MLEDKETNTHKCYAYMPETDEIIEYDEALSQDMKEQYFDEVCKRCKFVGLGYIIGTSIENPPRVWTTEELDLIFVN